MHAPLRAERVLLKLSQVDTVAVHTNHVDMKVTLSIDAGLVERARQLAAQQGTSLNQMIRRLLEDATAATAREALLGELEQLWAEENGDSGGRTWTREELYNRPVLAIAPGVSDIGERGP